MSLVQGAGNIFIEKEENYIKQTFRNRCIILSASGPLILSVPVLSGSSHKVPVKDIEIDYSKRWQQLHLRGVTASYMSSPFFEYFIHLVENVITSNHKWLIDLNMHSLRVVSDIIKIPTVISYTSEFEPVKEEIYDFRYQISPKKPLRKEVFRFNNYYQVFGDRTGFVPGLSVLDLVFNNGPDAAGYLESMRAG